MGRHSPFRELEPIERRVALMHVAGATMNVIAIMTESDETLISQIIARPRVVNFMQVMHGATSDAITPGVECLTEAINAAAERAFEIEQDVMETLYDNKESIRAQIGAASTAQDILDRAGHKAPAKAITYNMHEIAPASISQLARAMNEVSNGEAKDITPSEEDSS